MKPIRTAIGIGGIGLAVLGAGCATATVPSTRVASTQAAIRSAEEVGAQHVPVATLHLQLAKEQSDYAATLIQKGDNDRANYVLMRAQSDAELALGLARQTRERAEADQALERVRSLQKQVTSGS